jgi:hypothetical protein
MQKIKSRVMNPHKDWAQGKIQEAKLPTKTKILKNFQKMGWRPLSELGRPSET